jgi:hypothetical protein
MSEKRICPAGHEYWWPAARWQHEQCATNTERLTGATNTAEGKSEPDVVLARVKKARVVRANKAAGGNRDERVSQKAVGSNRTANRRSRLTQRLTMNHMRLTELLPCEQMGLCEYPRCLSRCKDEKCQSLCHTKPRIGEAERPTTPTNGTT